MLCTLAQVKALLGIPTADTDSDAVLTTLAGGVSERLAREAGRIHGGRGALEFSVGAALTQLFSPAERLHTLWLAAWPVVSITSIHEALYGDYADVDPLVENTDYQLRADVGGLFRIGTWLRGVNSVRAIYAGGYTPPTAAPDWESGEDYAKDELVAYGGAVYAAKAAIEGSVVAPPAATTAWTVQTGQVALPGDIVRVACAQAATWWQERRHLGVTSAGVQGSSWSRYAGDDLTKDAREVMAGYRRMS